MEEAISKSEQEEIDEEVHPGEKNKTKGNYIFSKGLGRLMRGISIRTQYEASMMSMVCILLGLIIFGVYLVFWGDLNLFSRIMVGINAGAGFFFLASFLVTTFQQYQTYLLAIGAMEAQAEEELAQLDTKEEMINKELVEQEFKKLEEKINKGKADTSKRENKFEGKYIG